jgi:hypothetical protein
MKALFNRQFRPALNDPQKIPCRIDVLGTMTDFNFQVLLRSSAKAMMSR